MAHLDDGAGREEVDGARDVGEVALGRREELDVEEKSRVSLRGGFVKVGKTQQQKMRFWFQRFACARTDWMLKLRTWRSRAGIKF